MWNFLNEIPKWLARNVSAWIGRETQADVMYRGSASSQTRTQAERSARGVHPLFICLIGIGTVQPVFVVFAAERCPAANATKVVSVQGNVSWSVINNAALQSAKLNDVLCVGDTVRVGAKSRAVLRLPNETTIPLDQNTVFRLKEAITQKDPTLIELIQGAIHVITRTPKPFKVNTPYLNAFVEGTEFYVGVDESEARVAVIEGKVNVSNDQGAVLLVDNEAATARKGQAPQKTLTIKPRDAVQWALYYPPLFDPRSRAGGENLAASHDRYSQGDITGAIERLDAVPEAQRNEDYGTYRAGLLLLVGRADEAEPDIERALAENGNNTDALSLKAIIAIVKNDKAKALELANQAVNIDDKSASARIALSYALQANFKIEDALKAARDATLRDADNALAWARVAELELSIPNYDKSKEAAERAVKLNPNLARTQSVLGFANLTRIDIKAAMENFNRAIELDQADPLPRLGLGLATIREGKLTEGREQIEIAATLDPENSLIRSYLGKAYYEEKRDDKAAIQFDLAKERDPNDPTPYFYRAITEQTGNRPGVALKDLNKSIALNEGRAVYRSRLLIDDDQAARTASLANIYGELGFERLSINESAKALAENAANSSAHRELAVAYANVPRHDIARVSESLQAQIRQPLAISPINPQISSDNLVILRDTGPANLGAYEFNQLFSRDQVRVQFDGIAGSLGTLGDQFILSGLTKKVAYAISHLQYETNGFGENNDTKKNAYDIFVQGEISPRVSLQTNVRRSDFILGQTFFQFDPALIFPAKIKEKSDSVRIGGRFLAGTGNDWIWSVIYEDRFRVGETFPDEFIITTTDTKAYTAELQHIRKLGETQIIGGLGFTEEKNLFALEEADSKTKATNAYLYSIWSPKRAPVKVQLGFSADWFQLKNSLFDDPIVRRRLNPKLGVVWNPMIDTTVRASVTSSVKRPFIGSQTLEPTQVVGFNQFFTGYDILFGDRDGTISRRVGIAVDQRFSASIFAGLELSARKLQVRSLNVGEVDWKEKTAHAYLYKSPTTPIFLGLQYAASVEYEYERIVRPQLLPGPEGIVDVQTHRMPFGFRLFRDSGWSCRTTIAYVKQSGTFSADINNPRFEKSDSAWITDVTMEYRLPKRRGTISVGARNIFDTPVDLFETDPVNPRTAKGRLVFGRARLLF